ncbi:hypothetical protein HUN41_00057 [Streptomyces phage Coruscant]|uniref:Uncharacterized protein n=1 Tax=Streptomyces phage Coruscant TaxID=2739834 RepID=A0A7G4AVZ6_9CAUD|nr:hypothetical protein PP454_gp231 [Streptomyces phage Coruscant]QMP84186.1 hypothetical protein HUN41_00057 [Streptomyces phage Coruscant]
MAKGKAFVGVNVDTVEVASLTGFLTTLSAQIETDANMGPVLNYAHSELSKKFDSYMAAVAPASPKSFHHVYEWNAIGIPQAQLWTNVLRGRGNNRYASFEFRASTRPVPVHQGEKKQFRQVHRFVYKAMIMEYNIAVTVKRKRAKMLAFPGSNGKIVFTKGPIVIENPGGQATTGAFTAAWAEWWTGAGANQVFNDSINDTLQNDLSERAMMKFMRRFRKAKPKTGKINVADSKTAFNQGAKLAEQFLEERAKKNEGRRKTSGI